MNLEKCKHGHYYDQDKFVKCPYCAAKGFVPKDTLRLNGENTEGCTEKKKIEQEKSLKDAVAATIELKKSMELEERQTADLREYENLPVGILVSIGNFQKGNIIPLYVGENCICMDGEVITIQPERKEEMQIASISFHPERNLFIMKPMIEQPEIWIGRMQLKDSVRLSPYDRIIIASAAFLFVSICGEQFHWV